MSYEIRQLLSERFRSAGDRCRRKADDNPEDERTLAAANALAQAANEVLEINGHPLYQKLEYLASSAAARNHEDLWSGFWLEVETRQIITHHGFGASDTRKTVELLDALDRAADEVLRHRW